VHALAENKAIHRRQACGWKASPRAAKRVVLAHQERAARYQLAHVGNHYHTSVAAGNQRPEKFGACRRTCQRLHRASTRVSGRSIDPGALFIVSKGAHSLTVRGYATPAAAARPSHEFTTAIELIRKRARRSLHSKRCRHRHRDGC
jgi:hypothetical protein